MNSCSCNYTDIIEVKFLADDSKCIVFNVPFCIYSPIISCTSDDTVAADCKIIQGDPTGDSFVCIMNGMSASLTVEESVSVAGRKFSCSLSFSFKRDKHKEMQSQIRKLRNSNYHILITYLGGTQHLIRTIQDSWLMSIKESEGKIQVNIKAENISGAQQVHSVS